MAKTKREQANELFAQGIYRGSEIQALGLKPETHSRYLNDFIESQKPEPEPSPEPVEEEAPTSPIPFVFLSTLPVGAGFWLNGIEYMIKPNRTCARLERVGDFKREIYAENIPADTLVLPT